MVNDVEKIARALRKCRELLSDLKRDHAGRYGLSITERERATEAIVAADMALESLR